jgi:hypothetical protein
MQGHVNFGGKTANKFLKETFIPQMFENFQKNIEISRSFKSKLFKRTTFEKVEFVGK